MGHRNQVVGIIELDADPNLDAPLDENIGQTFCRLRRGSSSIEPLEPSFESAEPSPADWSLDDDTSCNSVVVLKADLGQLACELESELARLLDHLLLLSHQ